jgi:hypothetical protein
MDRPRLLAEISTLRRRDARRHRHDIDNDVVAGFWEAGELPPLPPPTGAQAAVLDRLGPVGITIRGHDLAELLNPAYEVLTRAVEQ